MHHVQSILSVILVFAIISATGCHYFSDEFGEQKMLPTPLPAEFPYEVHGRSYKIWIGNEMQVKGEKHTSYILMQGVNNPDTGDEREDYAIAKLIDLVSDAELRIVVVARDQFEREIGQVFKGDQNINLELVRSGWGQFDGSVFERSDEFERLSNEAKQAKRGMWADQ